MFVFWVVIALLYFLCFELSWIGTLFVISSVAPMKSKRVKNAALFPFWVDARSTLCFELDELCVVPVVSSNDYSYSSYSIQFLLLCVLHV